MFQLQWNSLKTLIKKFSCQICQDKEAPKFSLMINIHVSLLKKHKKCMEKWIFHCVVYFLYQSHKQFSQVSIRSIHSIERMLSVHMGSSPRSFPHVRVTQQMTQPHDTEVWSSIHIFLLWHRLQSVHTVHVSLFHHHCCYNRPCASGHAAMNIV